MTLRKRFLHADPKFFMPSGTRLFMGLFIGVVFAMLFYRLMGTTREVMRVLSVTDECDIITLTPGELHFWDFFLACLSWTFAQSLCFVIWFDGPLARYGRWGRRVGAAINDNRMLNLSFLSWFSRFAMIYMIYFCLTCTTYDLGLLEYFRVGFVLMLIVVFLHPWLTVVRVFRRRAMGWMVCSAVLISALALGMSRARPIYFSAVDEMILARNIPHNYHVRLPRVASGWDFRYHHAIAGTINVVAPKDSAAAGPVIIMQSDYQHDGLATLHQTSVDSIAPKVAQWMEVQKEYYPPSMTPYCRLRINDDVPMELVGRIKTQLWRAGIRWVGYAVAPARAVMGYRAPYYDNWIISLLLSPAYAGPEAVDEGLRHLKTVGNVVELRHLGDGYTVNGQTVGAGELPQTLYASIRQNPDYVIRYHIPGRTLYGKYIGTLVAIRGAVERLREESMLSRYGRIFNPGDPQYREVQKDYPLRIVELTEEMEMRSREEYVP